MSRTNLFASLFLFIATSVAAFASPTQGRNQASAKLYQHADGDCLQIAIEVEIGFGWHLYHDDLGNPDAIGKPTVIELLGEGLEFSELRFPTPLKLEQEGLGTWIYGHEGTIVIYASARGNTASAVTADLSGLTCEDSGTCVLYGESVTSVGDGGDLFTAFPADLCGTSGGSGDAAGGTHASEGSTATAADGTPGATDYDAVKFPDFESQTKPIERSLIIWLLIAFLAGMILNVMPCVLPVISIKILSFVQQAGEDRARIFKLGVAFAAGIVVVFLVLAALALSLNLSWGQQFQSAEFLVVMIGIVFAFALSMFGVYELGVPQAVGAAASGPPREGLADAFFKGMLATLLATPCSGPFLGTTLTWTLSQPPVTVVAIFLSLGLGMAFPYVVLTAQPALLKFLPKPGAWMETFKQAMGFVLMATVVYLMISLRQDLLLFTIAFLVFVAMGCWWWGRFATYDQSSAQRMGTFGMSILIVALGAQISFKSFRGLFESDHDGAVEWIDFDPDQFKADLGEHSVFVDFTADWCPNCKYNETFVYDSEEVQQKFAEKGVVVYKADITHKGARTSMIERLMSKLDTVSIPFMAVFPHTSPNEPLTRFAIVKQADMLALLESLPAPK
ncbi:MAG: thiol:disulfide interchange protein [Chlamydiales bacterium]|jgi:thiol:disulfide interchange protein